MVNYFIANTPFQLFVISNIITQFYKDNCYSNYVISTTKKDTIISYASIINIRSNFKSIYKIMLLEKHITSILKSESINFFIPHLNNLFSSYFYFLAKKYNCNLNVYYEGVALFYRPKIRLARYKLLERSFIAFFTGLKYEKSDELFDEYIFENAICFTPEKELCSHFKKRVLFSFNNIDYIPNNNSLILTSDVLTDNDITAIISLMEKQSFYDNIYIKPHYSLSINQLNKLVHRVNENLNLSSIILDSNKPLEWYYDKIQFSKIISQSYSSALINIRLIFHNKINIFILDPKVPVELEKVFSYFGLTK